MSFALDANSCFHAQCARYYLTQRRRDAKGDFESWGSTPDPDARKSQAIFGREVTAPEYLSAPLRLCVKRKQDLLFDMPTAAFMRNAQEPKRECARAEGIGLPEGEA